MRLKGDASRFSSEAGKIATLLREAKHAIALTGAGISTDSGIPDFRSPKTGLWNQKDAKQLTEPGAFEKAMEYFWKFGYEIGKKILKAKPNSGIKSSPDGRRSSGSSRPSSRRTSTSSTSARARRM